MIKLTKRAARRAEYGTNRFSAKFSQPFKAPKSKTIDIPCSKLGCKNFAKVPTFFGLSADRRFYCDQHKRTKTTRPESDQMLGGK